MRNTSRTLEFNFMSLCLLSAENPHAQDSLCVVFAHGLITQPCASERYEDSFSKHRESCDDQTSRTCLANTAHGERSTDSMKEIS